MLQLGSDQIVAITVPQMKSLNLVKVEYDHLKNQRKWDSTEIANYLLLTANLNEQLSLKDRMLTDKSEQVGIYQELAATYQGKERKLTIKLTQQRTQKNIFGISAVTLAAVVAGLLYFR